MNVQKEPWQFLSWDFWQFWPENSNRNSMPFSVSMETCEDIEMSGACYWYRNNNIYEGHRVEICEETYFMWAFGELDTWNSWDKS